MTVSTTTERPAPAFGDVEWVRVAAIIDAGLLPRGVRDALPPGAVPAQWEISVRRPRMEDIPLAEDFHAATRIAWLSAWLPDFEVLAVRPLVPEPIRCPIERNTECGECLSGAIEVDCQQCVICGMTVCPQCAPTHTKRCRRWTRRGAV